MGENTIYERDWHFKVYEGDESYGFISYKREDSATVAKYAKALSDKGERLWYDYGINAGDNWEEIISEHLSGASYMVLFVTRNMFRSNEIKKEFQLAKAKNIKIIPVFLEEINANDIEAKNNLFLTELNMKEGFVVQNFSDECTVAGEIIRELGVKAAEGAEMETQPTVIEPTRSYTGAELAECVGDLYDVEKSLLQQKRTMLELVDKANALGEARNIPEPSKPQKKAYPNKVYPKKANVGKGRYPEKPEKRKFRFIPAIKDPDGYDPMFAMTLAILGFTLAFMTLYIIGIVWSECYFFEYTEIKQTKFQIILGEIVGIDINNGNISTETQIINAVIVALAVGIIISLISTIIVALSNFDGIVFGFCMYGAVVVLVAAVIFAIVTLISITANGGFLEGILAIVVIAIYYICAAVIAIPVCLAIALLDVTVMPLIALIIQAFVNPAVNARIEAKYNKQCRAIDAEYNSKVQIADTEYARQVQAIDAEHQGRMAAVDRENAAAMAEYEREMQRHRDALAADERRVRTETSQISAINSQISVMLKKYAQTESALEALYEKSPIHTNLRHIIPIGYMNELLQLRVCTKLEGADGLNYMVRQLTTEQKLSSIDDVINNFSRLIDRNMMMYSELPKLSNSAKKLADDTAALIFARVDLNSTDADIEEVLKVTAVQTYLSEREAKEQEYIESRIFQ